MKPARAKQRLKVNPPIGNVPALQFCSPTELRIDPTYQRDVRNGASQILIRRIATNWNWDLCQPLVVARRTDFTERLFVIDGQHRLEAARLRRDIKLLPCVIVDFASTAAEAASFVSLNQQRRALSKLEIFKAAIASGNPEANAIVAAIAEAGLSVAPHLNYISWKPGMISNIGGVETAWRINGPKVTERALVALRLGFQGQVLRYAGTIFPGIVAACSDEMAGRQEFGGERFERFCSRLRRSRQDEWRNAIMQQRTDDPNLHFAAASAHVVRREWRKHLGANAPAEVRFEVFSDGKAWCDQCDMLITEGQAASCKSRFCSLKVVA